MQLLDLMAPKLCTDLLTKAGVLQCRVDMVLVGAEGVVENGGIINKLGTYNIALAAAAHQKPVYVAAESYKVEIPSSTLVVMQLYASLWTAAIILNLQDCD